MTEASEILLKIMKGEMSVDEARQKVGFLYGLSPSARADEMGAIGHSWARPGPLDAIAEKPSLLYTMTVDDALSVTQVEMLKERWYDLWGGKDQAPRLMVLTHGAKLSALPA